MNFIKDQRAERIMNDADQISDGLFTISAQHYLVEMVLYVCGDETCYEIVTKEIPEEYCLYSADEICRKTFKNDETLASIGKHVETVYISDQADALSYYFDKVATYNHL